LQVEVEINGHKNAPVAYSDLSITIDNMKPAASQQIKVF